MTRRDRSTCETPAGKGLGGPRALLRVAALASLAGCSSPYSLAPGWAYSASGGAGDHVTPPFVDDGGFGGCFAHPPEELAIPTSPARPPPPISGGTMAVVGDTVVIGDADRDQLYLVSPDLRTSSTLRLQEGDEPGRVAAGPPGLAFVALRRAGAVVAIDLASKQLVGRLEACPAARGLAWVERASSLFVACATGELAQLELRADGTLLRRTVSRPAADLRDVVDTGDGLLLTTFRDATALHRADDGRLSAQPGPGANPDALDDFGMAPHVAWRTVAARGGVLMLYQGSRPGPVGAGCGAAAVSSSTPGQISGYGSAATGGVGSGGGGVVRSVLVKLTPSGRESAMDLVAPMTVDVATSASGAEFATASVGGAVLRQGETFGNTTSQIPGQPVAIAYAGERLLVYSREPATLFALESGAVSAKLTLSTQSAESTGHTLFHLPTQVGIACASCHPEAGEDGHVWQLPEGARRTPTLRGGIKGTAPFHWGGELASMDTLMAAVMTGRMAGAPESPARVAALEDWLDAQPAIPSPSWLDARAVARGRKLFEGAAACSGCHAGALGTNNATLAVGTGEALQVPRLVELARRAPYFHDGRIPTLAARFTPEGGGDRHGNVEALSEGQLADLVAYLASR